MINCKDCLHLKVRTFKDRDEIHFSPSLPVLKRLRDHGKVRVYFCRHDMHPKQGYLIDNIAIGKCGFFEDMDG